MIHDNKTDADHRLPLPAGKVHLTAGGALAVDMRAALREGARAAAETRLVGASIEASGAKPGPNDNPSSGAAALSLNANQSGDAGTGAGKSPPPGKGSDGAASEAKPQGKDGSSAATAAS